MKTGVVPWLVIWGLAFSLLPGSVLAAMYYNTQSYSGNGVIGAVGNGSLSMSNNTTTVKASFTKGTGSFGPAYSLVIFIDSAPGGFTSTSPFSEHGSVQETAISGVGPTKSSVANFASGFAADYAIVLNVDYPGYLYKLVQDDTGAHLQMVMSASLNFGPGGLPNNPSFSFQFNWADIGLPAQNTNYFAFETSYIADSGSRTLQSFEGLTGTEGFSTITFTNYDTYGVKPIPENNNAALAVFGGIVLITAVGTRMKRRCLRARRPLRIG
jgi:hypothetical protein